MRQNKRIKRKSITKLTSSISSSGIVTTTKTTVDQETEQKVEMTKEEIEKKEIDRKKAMRREQGLNHMRQAKRIISEKKSPSSKSVLPPSKNVTHAEIIRLDEEIER